MSDEIRKQAEKEVSEIKLPYSLESIMAISSELRRLQAIERMFNRIKSICVGDKTFLTGAQIKIIEKQERE